MKKFFLLASIIATYVSGMDFNRFFSAPLSSQQEAMVHQKIASIASQYNSSVDQKVIIDHLKKNNNGSFQGLNEMQTALSVWLGLAEASKEQGFPAITLPPVYIRLNQ